MGSVETGIVGQILEYLEVIHIDAWRQNTTGIPMRNGKFRKAAIKGVADILGIFPSGRFLAIEVKAPGEPFNDEDQIKFRDRILRNKGFHMVAYSVEEVNIAFKNLRKEGKL